MKQPPCWDDHSEIFATLLDPCPKVVETLNIYNLSCCFMSADISKILRVLRLLDLVKK